MTTPAYEIGIIGLGVIGRNLALNFAGQGYAVAAYDKNGAKVDALRLEAEGLNIFDTESLDDFVCALARPRTIMILVPAGPPVDAVIERLLPLLHPGDMLIDGGNSHFRDTNERIATLDKTGILYLGVGISGGEQGARNGPSLMPGGDRETYERIRPLFEAAAARVDGTPCVTYLGHGSAGHYVKMVHNGLEYAIMQLIAESYAIMKRGLGLGNDKLHAVFDLWNREELSSFLLEITVQIFRQVDEKTGLPLIDTIHDEVRPKETGAWSSQEATKIQVPVPAIDVAVMMHALAALKPERESASAILAGPKHFYQDDRKTFLDYLKNALYAGMIITFAQGMAHLRKASDSYGYELNLADVARVWRGGSIIRSALLKEILLSFQERPDLANLLLDPYLGQEVVARQADLRTVVRTAAELGIPAPSFMSAISYYDSYRSEWLPTNLIQAQRDFF